MKDKTSILLTRSHDDAKGSEDCSYCHGKRTLYSGEEEKDLKYHKLGFTTNKFRVNDYELLLQKGFTRCGTYVYIRNQIKSCCEIYQYKVPIADFKMNRAQRQTMKRFHRYIQTGSVNAPIEEEKKESKPKQGQDTQNAELNELVLKLRAAVEQDMLEIFGVAVPELNQTLKNEEELKKSHRVQYNKAFKCVSSNLIMVATKSLPEEKKEHMKKQENLDTLCQKLKADVGLEVTIKN